MASMIRPLIRQWKQSTEVSLLTNSRIGVAILLLLSVIAGYLLWIFGTVNVGGIPLQIVVVGILFPLFLCVLVFWFAKQQDRHEWQSNDED